MAFADTEGVHGKNELWSVTLMFSAIVLGPKCLSTNLPKLEYNSGCFHLLSFNSQEAGGRTRNAKALSSHFDAIHHLQEEYDTEGVLLCFWNASHDKKQLQVYKEEIEKFPNLNLIFVDMIKFVKNLARFPRYKLDYLRYDVYGSKHEKRVGERQDHTSLHDTISMLNVLYAVVLDSTAEQVLNPSTSIVEYKERPEIISQTFKTAPRSLKVKTVVTHEAFLVGVLVATTPTAREERSSSVHLLPPPIAASPIHVTTSKYDFFTIDDVEYKIRKGYESSDSSWYKGYGLYCRKGARFQKILNKERKKNIINLIRTLQAKEQQIDRELHEHELFYDAEEALQQAVLM